MTPYDEQCSTPAALASDGVAGRRRRPAYMNWRRHRDLCPDCWNGLPCRMEQRYARKADIEDGRLLGWPADERGR